MFNTFPTNRSHKNVRKRWNKNLKNVKNVKRDKNKKHVCKRNKKRYLFSVWFNFTPDAQEMAFKANPNMPLSLVL